MEWVQTSRTQYVKKVSDQEFEIINVTESNDSCKIKEDVIDLTLYTSFEKRRILHEYGYVYRNGMLFDPLSNEVPEGIINQFTAELISETDWFKSATDTHVISKSDITETLKSCYGIYPAHRAEGT